MESMNLQLAVSLSHGYYAWMAESKSYCVYGTSKKEAIEAFKECYIAEEGKIWNGLMTEKDTPSGVKK